MNTRLRQWVKRMQTRIFLTRAKVYTCLRRLEKKGKAWRLGTLVRVVEFLAVLIAFIAFCNELSYRHEERTARAWQLLITPASGNSGKGEALSYLNSRKVPLAGIDLTPPILAEQWKRIPKEERILVGRCTQFTYLREVELSEAVLVRATLVCADLQGADLRETRLIGAQLQGADLRRAKLQGADLSGAQLQRANLMAQLQGADLSGARLQGANLMEAQLQGADLRRARLQGANLMEAQLQDVDLRTAQLQGATLREARLQGATLRDAQLQGANLTGAKLQGADLGRARLEDANFWGARGTQLQGADLRDAQLQGANLTGAKLQGADLSGAELQDANLNRADLRATRGILCADLKQARNWVTAYRDGNLACGQLIPEAPPQR